MQIVPGSAFFKTVSGSAGARPDPTPARQQAAAAAQGSDAGQSARRSEAPRRVQEPSPSNEIRRDLPRGSFIDIQV